MNVEQEILDLKKVVYGKLLDFGESSEAQYAPDSVSVPNDEWHAIATVTLAKGSYLIIYGAAFATNATGSRQLHFAVNSTTAGRFSPSVAAVSGEQTRMNATITYAVSTDTATLSLWAKQNSGSSLNAWGYVRAIKLQ